MIQQFLSTYQKKSKTLIQEIPTWRLNENSTTLKWPVYAKWADFNAFGTGESWPLMESCL